MVRWALRYLFSFASVTLLIATSWAAPLQSDRDPGDVPGCAKPVAEIDRVERPTGVLRADRFANDTAQQRIADDVERACQSFSRPDATRGARLQISDNHIIVNGVVPSDRDEQVVLNIVGVNADGRAVFNRLEARARPEVPQTASLR